MTVPRVVGESPVAICPLCLDRPTADVVNGQAVCTSCAVAERRLDQFRRNFAVDQALLREIFDKPKLSDLIRIVGV